MRVLLITSEFPPYSWGGLGRYSFEVCRELGRRGFRVDVINVPLYYPLLLREGRVWRDRLRVEERDHGVVVTYSDKACLLGLLRSLNSNDLRGFNRGSEAVVRDVMSRALPGSRQYDVIYAQDYYVSAVAVEMMLERVGKVLITASHLPAYSGFTYFDKPISDEAQFALEYRLLRFSRKVIVPSNFARRVVLQVYSVSPHNVVVIPLGVRQPPPEGRASGSSGFRGGKRLRLLTVARLTDQKGIHFIAEILPRLHDRGLNFEYVIVGRGPREREFQDLLARKCASCIHRIRRVSYMPPAGLAKLYEASDLYISTSLYETFGLTVLEAMSRGCVPVAFDVGALDEIIDDGRTGFLVSVGDVEGMVDRVVKLWRDRRLLLRIGEEAVNKARKYTWEKHVDTLSRVFLGALKGC